MRRMYVRGADNVFQRVLVQAAAFNIGLLLRKLSGWGKPRQAQGRQSRLRALFLAIFVVFDTHRGVSGWLGRFGSRLFPEISAVPGLRVAPQ